MTTSQTKMSDSYQNMLLSTRDRVDTVLMMENSNIENNEESLNHYIKAQIISKD
jgi:hypothetical protein